MFVIKDGKIPNNEFLLSRTLHYSVEEEKIIIHIINKLFEHDKHQDKGNVNCQDESGKYNFKLDGNGCSH